MDRLKNIRLALTFWLLLWTFPGFNCVIAEELVSQKTTAEIAEKQVSALDNTSSQHTPQNKPELPGASNMTGATFTEVLATQFPQLQRALIILTIINLVVITFASLMYLVKRRMQQFSPAPLTKLKQEG